MVEKFSYAKRDWKNMGFICEFQTETQIDFLSFLLEVPPTFPHQGLLIAATISIRLED